MKTLRYTLVLLVSCLALSLINWIVDPPVLGALGYQDWILAVTAYNTARAGYEYLEGA